MCIRDSVKVGDQLAPGSIYAECPETTIIKHRCMVPPRLSGEVVKVFPNGQYRIHDTVVVLKDEKGQEHNLTLCQKWPIRTPVSYTHLSSNVILSKARAMYGQRLVWKDYQTLLGCHSVNEIAAYLKQTPRYREILVGINERERCV